MGEVTGATPALLNLTAGRCIEDWTGAVVDDTTNSVSAFNLADATLRGAIPAEFETPDLFSNFLNGPIPGEPGRLTHLGILDLKGNSLSGNIPSTLETLDLSNNFLTGAVPTGLGNLSNITVFQMLYNRLQGSVTAELSNLSGLQAPWPLWQTAHGSALTSLTNLSNLHALHISDNQVSRCLPAALRIITSNDLNLLNMLDCQNLPYLGTSPNGAG